RARRGERLCLCLIQDRRGLQTSRQAEIPPQLSLDLTSGQINLVAGKRGEQGCLEELFLQFLGIVACGQMNLVAGFRCWRWGGWLCDGWPNAEPEPQRRPDQDGCRDREVRQTP